VEGCGFVSETGDEALDILELAAHLKEKHRMDNTAYYMQVLQRLANYIPLLKEERARRLRGYVT